VEPFLLKVDNARWPAEITRGPPDQSDPELSASISKSELAAIVAGAGRTKDGTAFAGLRPGRLTVGPGRPDTRKVSRLVRHQRRHAHHEPIDSSTTCEFKRAGTAALSEWIEQPAFKRLLNVKDQPVAFCP
jgi:hypothetical protein